MSPDVVTEPQLKVPRLEGEDSSVFAASFEPGVVSWAPAFAASKWELATYFSRGTAVAPECERIASQFEEDTHDFHTLHYVPAMSSEEIESCFNK